VLWGEAKPLSSWSKMVSNSRAFAVCAAGSASASASIVARQLQALSNSARACAALSILQLATCKHAGGHSTLLDMSKRYACTIMLHAGPWDAARQ
jgi:hypothetical protein